MGRHGLLLGIKDSPAELAGDRTRFTWQKAGRAERAEQIGAQLRKREKAFWDHLNEETAGTPTKLSGAGWRTAGALMHHGYLSARVLLWAEYGEALPRLEELRRAESSWPRSPDQPFELRDEKYFLDLARGEIESGGKKPVTTASVKDRRGGPEDPLPRQRERTVRRRAATPAAASAASVRIPGSGTAVGVLSARPKPSSTSPAP